MRNRLGILFGTGWLACCIGTLPARAEDSKSFDPLSSAFWTSRLLNQNEEGDPTYIGHFLLGKDEEPIGVTFVMSGMMSRFVQKVRSEPLGPWPCSFMAVGWTLRENYGYAARLVLGPDRGLVGISFRVWNNSSTMPLVLLKYPGEPPFYTEILEASEEGATGRNLRRDYKEIGERRDPKKEVEWTLAPRQKEDFFVPVRDLLVEGFDPKNGKLFSLQFFPILIPKGTPDTLHGVYPRYPYIPAIVTKASLVSDPHLVFKAAASYAKAALDSR